MIRAEGSHTPLKLELAAAFMRQAYANGYSDALSEPTADLQSAFGQERKAWANLPAC